MSISFQSSFFAHSIQAPKPAKDISFSGISTDTRDIKPGFLFVALAGEKRDGHAFIEEAIAKGASGILHRKDFSFPGKGSILSFPVNDTLLAYRLFAKAWRMQFSFPVIVVAGSAGKTTTKEFLSALLRGKWKNVHQTKSSQNGFAGIPATLLGLRDFHEAAVIEVGIDEPNTMEQHLAIVNPTAGLLTSIGPEHLEKLIDVKTVAKEEGKLFSFLLEKNGKIAINCDDPLILKAGEGKAEKIFYGLEKRNDKKPFLWGSVDKESSKITVTGDSLQSFSLPLPLAGSHNARNLLGAIAMAHSLGLNSKEMAVGLKTFIPPPGRGEIHSWRGNIHVYCDTYNANPLSVEAALNMFMKSSPAASQTWICLGDMLELGSQEESLHRSLAKILLKNNPTHILLFGPKMQFLANELKAAKFSGRLAHFSKIEDLSQTLLKEVKPHAHILLKGSRGMRMEQIWDVLQKNEN